MTPADGDEPRHGIAGDAEEPGVAERDKAGIADEHIEAEREDGVDQDLADDVDVIAVDDPQRHGSKRYEPEPKRDRSAHGACLPNNPCGRTSRTSNIGRERMMEA